MEYVEYRNDEMPDIADLPACPVETTAQLIGSKWRLLIMRDLLSGPKRFGELKRSVGNISQKVLTSNLRDMEAHGLVVRRVYPEVPPRVEYLLTETGESLRPIIEAMWTWGETYQDNARR
ncbi:MAG: winged helix-turn-helix transcriptional regulator [Eggerthellaceae bacterium]|jgi:DNA-binding HxlR family transcriptional regulator